MRLAWHPTWSMERKGLWRIGDVMVGTKEGTTDRVILSPATWISLIGMICAGVAANLALIHSMAGSMQDRMDVLDARWQDRTTEIRQSLSSDIKAVEAKIPPDWFRRMVERNTEQIDDLSNKLRDFAHNHSQDVLK